MSTVASKRCPKARYKSGRKAKPRVNHEPHNWWAGEYLPVGDFGYPAYCPGYNELIDGRNSTGK